MRDKGQTMRWSKGEMELFKNTFSGDKGEELLIQIRDVLMQFTEEVPKLNEDVLALLEKMILPKLTSDLPVGFQADIYNALAGTPERAGIKDVHPEVAILQIKAQDLVYDYLKQRIEVLRGKKTNYPISLLEMKNKMNKTDDERLISMLAYLFLEHGYIEGSLQSIKTVANHKDLTPEEQEKQAKMNSTK